MWSLPRQLAFRFGCLLALFTIWPFPFGSVPGTDAVAEALAVPWEWGTRGLAELSGIALPTDDAGGSGDSTAAWLMTALTLGLAVVGTVLWSVIDRRRSAYPRLARITESAVRHWLAFALLTYGLVKVFDIQFRGPNPFVLDGRVAEMSPMGLLWTFMGYSRPYAVFAGCAELLGGALLLWRRTRVLGLIVTIGVMANVAMLNLCYDVPVKLYSLTLLVTALVLIAPQLRRIGAALLGRGVPELPELSRDAPRWARRAHVAKFVLIAAMLGGLALPFRGYAMFFSPPTDLDGSWRVERFAVRGVQRPPLATDAMRWHRLIVAGGAKVGPNVMIAIRYQDDHVELRMAEIEPGSRTVELGSAIDLRTGRPGEVPDGTGVRWTYRRLDPDQLEIAVVDTDVRVTLRREPPGLLLTRPFHWIQERPFNR